jgi:hypothetical protein
MFAKFTPQYLNNAKTIKKLGFLPRWRLSGMNAAIRSVVRTCAYHNIECIGFIEVIRDDRRVLKKWDLEV